MNDIHVSCYSGYRADERPQRFTLRGREFQVSEVDGQWYSPDAIYFRVRPTTATITSCATTKARIPGR